jgi:uncharacterized protein with ATP-grasp and redox domains
MNSSLDCVPCFLRQSIEAARAATSNTRIHRQIVQDVLRMTAELDFDQPPPVVGQIIHRHVRALTGVKDPYQAAKNRCNRLAMEALPELSKVVQEARDPLLASATCAVAANAIDMGVSSAITDEEVRLALRATPGQPVYGEWEGFRKAAARATDILYLADNSGEIAVDRLVIEALGCKRVTVAVRGAPVLNDATVADAREVNMHELVKVIDNGSDAPGTILTDCSPSFRQRFDHADLIIAKGQGNFETLSDVDGPIAFWFKVKCPIVSRHLGLPVGTHVLLPPDTHRSSHGNPVEAGRP